MYNSQGAGSTINHFHAQLVDKASLLQNGDFHFESIQGGKITTLLVDLKGQGSTAKVEVGSFEYLGALFIRISSREHRIFDKAILESIAGVVWGVVETALESNTPHNLNIPNDHEVYVIIRNFAENVRCGWVEYSGIQNIANDQEYEGITAEEIAKRYEGLALPREFLEGKVRSLG